MKLAELIEKAGMTQSDFADKITLLAQFMQENHIPAWITASALGAVAKDERQVKALLTIMLVAQSDRSNADQVTAAAYKSSLN